MGVSFPLSRVASFPAAAVAGLVAAAAGGLLLAGCPSAETRAAEGPKPNEDGNAGVDVEAALRADRERAEAAGGRRMEGSGPEIVQIVLSPARPTLLDSVRASASLAPGASPYTEIDYAWFVNDVELTGVRRDELEGGGRWFRKGDTVRVEVRAEDEKGRRGSKKSSPLKIVNSKPEIVTDIRKARGLDGIRLEATDADGDELSWSITSGPPGVTVDERGVVRVKQTNVQAAWTGEVVVAASDPEGARAELHIPASLSAATSATVKEKQVERVRHADEVSEEDAARAMESAADRYVKMSKEEQAAYVQEQQRREDERKKREAEERRR